MSACMSGTRGSGVLSSTGDVLVRGVGGVCDMCMCLARGGVGGEGGEWLQTTQPTSGGAVTADKNCCANCVEPSRPHCWGRGGSTQFAQQLETTVTAPPLVGCVVWSQSRRQQHHRNRLQPKQTTITHNHSSTRHEQSIRHSQHTHTQTSHTNNHPTHHYQIHRKLHQRPQSIHRIQKQNINTNSKMVFHTL